jgi:hypothetical protein
VENQAYCRVFRIGQEKETEVTRIVMKDSIDDKLLKLQERKRLAIDPFMNGKNVVTREMAYELFGINKEDGGDFVMPDDRSFRSPPPAAKRGRGSTPKAQKERETLSPDSED